MNEPKRQNTEPAEDLHKLAKGTDKRASAEFVNPGTAASPLVGLAERKTGVISDSANAALQANLIKEPEQLSSMSQKTNAAEGILPKGKNA